jgi:hypothetical protein
MRLPKLPFPAYWLPLAVAVSCRIYGFWPLAATDSQLPTPSDIRLPVYRGKDRMGYIDGTGKMVLSARWRYASTFEADGLARVWDAGGGYFSISRSGELKLLQPPPQISERQVDPRFRPQGPDEQGMTLVWQSDRADRQRWRCHWILRDGTAAFSGWWDGARPFAGEFPAAVVTDGQWGFINRRGETVIPPEWDETLGFNASGLAPVARNGHWGAIDATGKLVVPLHFNSISAFDSAGMAAVRIGFGAGYINSKGRIVIPLRYMQAAPFDAHGMAKVMDGRSQKVGWIDHEGKLRVPFEFDLRDPQWVPVDHPRLLPVTVNGLAALIDRTGKWVVPPASGRIIMVRDPLAPGREWYVRAPAWDDPSQPPPPPFEPGCFDEAGHQIWSGSGGWSDLWADRRVYARWLAAVCGLAALMLFLKRRKMRGEGS